MSIQLLKRAVILFPKTDYLDPHSVRYARKKYLESVAYLRNRDLWILDKKVPRLQ